jgi:hypothetical protein
MNSNPAPNTYYLPNTRILTTTCLSAGRGGRCIETDKRFSTIVVPTIPLCKIIRNRSKV